MTFVIPYPAIDPVLFAWGPLVIRWYALAYVAGLLLGWRYLLVLARRPPQVATALHIDDFLVWATFGVILGGRLGYVVFYKPEYFFDNPLAIPQVWLGGMSFHGGMIGVAVATFLFARQRAIPLFHFSDLLASASPIGLFLGRIANFINGELYGRASDVPWAMVFPRGGPLARHPSQLYEAVLEGAVLFIVLFFLGRRESLRQRAGFLTGVFLAGYSVARGIAELFRQPDTHLGFLLGGTTMGQWLSIPMLVLGLYLIVRRRRPG
ncbi:MAG: prolipoprotein diacylglyceryl transferase [Rhodospirillales bacterium]|jgi:phosphatidylglycerol:prolipoprotein diacylglycerol transferase|nr:prolipoprotein diacylglyceryl transferase [Rhodospirillales bacterium]